MDVDKQEDDWDLINQLNTMGTRDKEELLSQFQSIVGTQMSPGCSKFYLEMGNWNLQTALCAYYDLSSSTDKLPSIELVEESYHINDCSLRPNQTFTKFWKLKNTGTEPWPVDLKLKFVKGYNFTHGETVLLNSIEPQQTIELRVHMKAPGIDGLYQGQWRGITLSGTYFGNTLTVAVNVDSSNVGDLTQQMLKLGHQNEMEVNSEQMREDNDLICTQQINVNPIILPTVTTHSFSQSNSFHPSSNLQQSQINTSQMNGVIHTQEQNLNTDSNMQEMIFDNRYNDQNITDS